MKKFLVFVILLVCTTLFANNVVDSITLTKIKKLVQKEEEIAAAYKKYILEKGVNPTTLNDLKTANYLPKGFDIINPFGKQITIILDNNSTTTDKKDDIHKIRGFESTDPKLKSNLYDFYYSNKYRTHTKAPLSINNSNIEIILSSKERFMYENSSKITTTAPNNSTKTPKDSYYLDKNGVLHWYDSSGNYKYSFDKELVLDESVTLLNSDGSVNSNYKNLVKDIEFAGMTILYKKDAVAQEHVNIGSGSVVKVNQQTRDIGKTVIQFSRRAGGMIVNGDIYTWGNIANRIVGINQNKYTKDNGSLGSNYPVITGLVRARVKTYNSTIDNQNYFSSSLRPKFVDFFSTVFHSTCGISTKGELYCGGLASAYQKGFLYSNVDPSNPSVEMLYKSKDFDGTTDKKATKIFANDGFWLIFGNTDIDSNGNYKNGRIYRWGATSRGFGGNNSLNYSSTNISELNIEDNKIKVLFKDLTYLLTIGHRKIGALSNQGDIYIWGTDYTSSCSVKWENINYNLCIPIKITISNSTMNSLIKFESIQGGLDAFVAKSENGKYYKLSHPINKQIQVISVDEVIKTYSEYVAENDAEILSVDFSRKLTDTNKSNSSTGIVWVNSKNELKGDYFTTTNKDDKMFKDAIKQIKWKKIKVIQDDNGMCGIDVNNQMYCWGMMSYYGSDMRDTFMLPVFNTNLYDTNKDFLIVEGGNSNLTNMTSDEWSTTNSDGKTGAFFMKYPTYIGGFNYEFIFK